MDKDTCTDYEELKAAALSDPEVRQAYDALGQEGDMDGFEEHEPPEEVAELHSFLRGKTVAGVSWCEDGIGLIFTDGSEIELRAVPVICWAMLTAEEAKRQAKEGI